MRKITLLFILALFTLNAAYSQFSIRPQIGINFPKLTDELLQGQFKGNAGYQFGADVQIGGSFYIQPGLNFQTTNFTMESVGDMHISRINIPLIVGLKIGEGQGSRAFGFRLFAGPNFAINVNERLDDSLGFINKDNIRNSQIAGLAGAGLDLSLIFVDVMYKFGMSDFFKDIETDASKNVFLVNAGVRLGF